MECPTLHLIRTLYYGDNTTYHVALQRFTGWLHQVARDHRRTLLDSRTGGHCWIRARSVVSSMTVCSLDNPIQALQEMARVCSPNGIILLLEHGRSSFWPWATWQDMKETGRRAYSSCHDNREPRHLAEEAGLQILSAHQTWFGAVHAIDARPGKVNLNDE